MNPRTPPYDMRIFAQRRKTLASKMSSQEALILTAHPVQMRNSDVPHPYRQDTNFFYLTGFEEPECVFVFRPHCSPETVLFVQEKDPLMETWTGFRYGPQQTQEVFQIDKAFNKKDFSQKIIPLLEDMKTIYFQKNVSSTINQKFEKLFQNLKKPVSIKNPESLLSEMRLYKSDEEIKFLKKACQISSQAHIELMKHTHPRQNERSLHGLFLKEIMQQGAVREGYGSIVASGPNACTLHYTFNDSELKKGDMLLVDAGAEYNFYSADITRTYPISGTFTTVQKRIYNKLLKLQKNLIQEVKPQMTFAKLQNQAIEGLINIMCEEKLLSGSQKEIKQTKSYTQFYPHNVGHWLGSDVHDCGGKKEKDQTRPFEPGMCLTIEPGLYIPEQTENASQELKGLGIRIEDDVLVTQTGHEVLTDSCPKEVEELEEIVGKSVL